jgi:hypothetical protein
MIEALYVPAILLALAICGSVIALGQTDHGQLGASLSARIRGFEVSYNNLIGAVRPHAQRLLLAGLTPLENRRKLSSKSGVTSDFSVP